MKRITVLDIMLIVYTPYCIWIIYIIGKSVWDEYHSDFHLLNYPLMLVINFWWPLCIGAILWAWKIKKIRSNQMPHVKHIWCIAGQYKNGDEWRGECYVCGCVRERIFTSYTYYLNGKGYDSAPSCPRTKKIKTK